MPLNIDLVQTAEPPEEPRVRRSSLRAELVPYVTRIPGIEAKPSKEETVTVPGLVARKVAGYVTAPIKGIARSIKEGLTETEEEKQKRLEPHSKEYYQRFGPYGLEEDRMFAIDERGLPEGAKEIDYKKLSKTAFDVLKTMGSETGKIPVAAWERIAGLFPEGSEARKFSEGSAAIAREREQVLDRTSKLGPRAEAATRAVTKAGLAAPAYMGGIGGLAKLAKLAGATPRLANFASLATGIPAVSAALAPKGHRIEAAVGSVPMIAAFGAASVIKSPYIRYPMTVGTMAHSTLSQEGLAPEGWTDLGLAVGFGVPGGRYIPPGGKTLRARRADLKAPEKVTIKIGALKYPVAAEEFWPLAKDGVPKRLSHWTKQEGLEYAARVLRPDVLADIHNAKDLMTRIKRVHPQLRDQQEPVWSKVSEEVWESAKAEPLGMKIRAHLEGLKAPTPGDVERPPSPTLERAILEGAERVRARVEAEWSAREGWNVPLETETFPAVERVPPLLTEKAKPRTPVERAKLQPKEEVVKVEPEKPKPLEDRAAQEKAAAAEAKARPPIRAIEHLPRSLVERRAYEVIRDRLNEKGKLELTEDQFKKLMREEFGEEPDIPRYWNRALETLEASKISEALDKYELANVAARQTEEFSTRAVLVDSMKTGGELISYAKTQQIETYGAKDIPTLKALIKERLAERLQEPPTLGELDPSAFPKATSVSRYESFVDWFDVKDRFNRMGFKTLGETVERSQAIYEMPRDKFLYVLRKKIFPIFKHDPDGGVKAMNELAFIDNPALLNKMNPKRRSQFVQAKAFHDALMKEHLDRYKGYKILTKGYPERLVDSLKAQKEAAQKNAENWTEGAARRGFAEEAQRLTQLIEQAEQLSFQHIPTAHWLMHLGSRYPKYSPKIRFYKGARQRKFHTLEEARKAFGPEVEKVTINDIYQSYSAQAGSDFLEAELALAAKADGAALPANKAPYWFVDPPPNVHTLKGYKLHPVASDWVWALSNPYQPARMGKVLGFIKGMAFAKPYFLAGNDFFQAMMNGTMNPVLWAYHRKTGLHLKKAWLDVVNRTPEFYEGFERNIFSQVHNNPWEVGHTMFEAATQGVGGQIYAALQRIVGGKGLEILASAPFKALGEVYSPSWNLAWFGDKVMRMNSYNWFKSIGYTPDQAAQITRLSHGHYPSFPAASRTVANKFAFTPTYKVAMFKYHKFIFEESFRGVKKMLAGEKLGFEQKAALTNLLGLVLGNLGIHAMMTMQGYEAVIPCFKYRRQIETDEGLQDMHVSVSIPITLMAKFSGRAFKALTDPTESNKPLAFLRQFKYEAHPAWRHLWDALVINKDSFGQPIMDKNDDAFEQSIAVFKHLAFSTVQMVSSFHQEAAFQTKYARSVAIEEMGLFNYMFMNLYSHVYFTDPRYKRIQSAWQGYQAAYKQMVKANYMNAYLGKKPADEAGIQSRLENVQEKAEALIREFEKEREYMKRQTQRRRKK